MRLMFNTRMLRHCNYNTTEQLISFKFRISDRLNLLVMPEKKPLTKKLTQELILDPAARLRDLSEAGSSVEINKAVPIKRYYRSGSEMERQVSARRKKTAWLLNHSRGWIKVRGCKDGVVGIY